MEGGLLPSLVAQPPRGRVRLRTLTYLRWMAVAGQSAALFLVDFGFGYPLPLVYCAAAILTSVALNIALALRYPANHRLTNREATWYLAFDILQLAALLYLTGGITNPFALMFVAPIVIAAASLNLGNTLILAGLGFTAICYISIWHMPLPWLGPFELAPEYQAGIWAALVLGIGFTSVYAWRIASETARMSAGLAATQLALSREHRLSALGALATAAAHELGTPLGTIAVVARELERSLPPGTSEFEDVKLLRAQAERCRAILARLSNPEEAMLGDTARLPIGAFLDEILSPYRGEDVEFSIALSSGAAEPQIWRAPELLHGLGNIVENAADFAKSKVKIEAEWNSARLSVSVEDDGPGFAPEIFMALGEPYVTSRPGRFAMREGAMEPAAGLDKHEGMGLGFFIAKTLIEQTGGSVNAVNLANGGAKVTVFWPRGVVDGAEPPGRFKIE